MSAPEREGLPAGLATASVVRWGIVALMAAVATASFVHVYAPFGRAARDASTAGPHAAAEPTRYHCPMHPQIVRDHPGECPICGMTMVPIEPASSSTSHGAAAERGSSPAGLAPVELSPERVQLAGIKLAPVVRRRLDGGLAASGVVTENERGLASINTRFAGWIQDLFVAETGRRVTKGQPLATIYSPDVLSAEQEFLTARRWTAGAPSGSAEAPMHAHESLTAGMADDARKRLELLGVAPQEIDDIARTGQPRRAVTIRSPANGTVLRRGAVAGGYVQPGSELFAIADLSTVWFIAEVYERDMARVRVGQSARIELAGLPGHAVQGRVQFLYPSVSAETRTMRVRAEVANPAGDLRPGMFGTMHLDMPGAPALAVPVDAVVDTGEAQYLFVTKGGGRFEPRRVKLGARGEGWVEILDGVTEGEGVVTTANFLIDSESRLRAAIEAGR